MQLVITLASDNRITLPIASNAVVQGLIYNALRGDSAFSYNLHEKGKEASGRNYKLFNFSEIKGRYDIEGKTIIYSSPISITIRSAQDYVIQLLMTNFTVGKELMLHNNFVRVTDVRLSNDTIYSECVRIKTLSPITVYITEDNGHTVYYSPKDREFCEGIVRNARRKYTAHFGSDEGFSLEVTPCEHARFIKRATRFKDTFITAWHGEFVLKGSAKTLNFLYNTGLGSKNSQGFGMFSVIE
ncbi:MAG: CRISPR-associated endoribonuclease Cas6 [Ruminococcus sp.]|nr:CRISPR-associated endoribonuclease Cas6 [Ruminococcus sp.]